MLQTGTPFSSPPTGRYYAEFWPLGAFDMQVDLVSGPEDRITMEQMYRQGAIRCAAGERVGKHHTIPPGNGVEALTRVLSNRTDWDCSHGGVELTYRTICDPIEKFPPGRDLRP